MKLKSSDIRPLRDKLLKLQDNKCAICKCDFSEGYYNRKKAKVMSKHTPCLDHDHSNGQVRGVLCSGCNSLEGKVINAIDRWHTSIYANDAYNVSRTLYALAHYITHHEIDRNSGMIHPSYRTAEEKRLLKNKRARLRRKKASQ